MGIKVCFYITGLLLFIVKKMNNKGVKCKLMKINSKKDVLKQYIYVDIQIP